MTTQKSVSCGVFLTELDEDIPEDFTHEVQNGDPVCTLSYDRKIHPLLEGGIVHGKRESHHRKGAATETDQDQEIRQSQKVLRIKVSGFSIIQNGSNSTPCQVPTCKYDSKNLPTSSDEESDSVTKTQEIEEDRQGTQVYSILGKPSSVHSPMPVIPKRGCMNTSGYILLITKLHYLQDKGEFELHEQIIREQLARRSPEDVDMEVSLKIERAMALFFQNNGKDAKRILKFVLKLEPQLKNPGILIGRALNLLTAVYKRQSKFGNAMRCVQEAQKALELQDSHEDKAELYQSYGALLNSLPAANITRDTRKTTAYKSYELACQYAVINREYINVKMAALLLKSCSKAANNNTHICKEDVMKAKRHLDLTESRTADGKMALGTRIKLLLLRSDQYCFEQNNAMAIEKAEEAKVLIQRHGFELELDSAERRISRLSDMLRLEKGEWSRSDLCSSSENQTDSEGDSSCLE